MERFYVDPVKSADITEVQTTLLVNDQLIPLNDFTQRISWKYNEGYSSGSWSRIPRNKAIYG